MLATDAKHSTLPWQCFHVFPSDKEQLTRKQMIEKKKKLKAMFDAEYDDKEGSSFYDDLKRDLDQQAQVLCPRNAYTSSNTR